MQGKSNQTHPTGLTLERACSHPRRREILRYITQKGDGACTDGAELAEALDLAASRVNYHLTVLQDANLIALANDGRESGKAERSFVAVAAVRR
jgi:DNA-binding transcriptional ArsR family regulator